MAWYLLAFLAACVFFATRWLYLPNKQKGGKALSTGQMAVVLAPPKWVSDIETYYTPAEKRALVDALLAASPPGIPVIAALDSALAKKQITLSSYVSARVAHALKNAGDCDNEVDVLMSVLSPFIGAMNSADVHPEMFLKNLMLFSGGMLSGARASVPMAFPVTNIMFELPICATCEKTIENTHLRRCASGHVYCESCTHDTCKKCDRELKWTLSPQILAE